MHTRITTARWQDAAALDGHRVLTMRWRPRGISLASQPWDHWDLRLAPSAALLRVGQIERKKAVVGSWERYAAAFALELAGDGAEGIDHHARRVLDGQRVVFLCACSDAARCHRSVVAEHVDRRVAELHAAHRGTP